MWRRALQEMLKDSLQAEGRTYQREAQIFRKDGKSPEGENMCANTEDFLLTHPRCRAVLSPAPGGCSYRLGALQLEQAGSVPARVSMLDWCTISCSVPCPPAAGPCLTQPHHSFRFGQGSHSPHYASLRTEGFFKSMLTAEGGWKGQKGLEEVKVLLGKTTRKGRLKKNLRLRQIKYIMRQKSKKSRTF